MRRTTMRRNIYQILCVGLLALGCTLNFGGSSGEEFEALVGDVQDTLDDLDEFVDAGTETLCAMNPCQTICYPYWRAREDVPAQCGVTCNMYPCQPVCAETDEGIDAETRGACRGALGV